MAPKKARRNTSGKKSRTPPPKGAPSEISPPSSPSTPAYTSDATSSPPLTAPKKLGVRTSSPEAKPAPHVSIPTNSSHASAAKKKKGEENSTVAAPSQWWLRVLLVLAAVVAIGVVTPSLGGAAPGPHQHHPCACATPAVAANPLAKALLSRRSGISGVHWQHRSGDPDRLAFEAGCSDLTVVDLPGPFTSAEMLRRELQTSFTGAKRRCVVWVTTPDAVRPIANALKELLENNALGGEPVVPAQARGLLAVKASHTREGLKELLPHRVVHMLTNIN